MDKQQTKQIEQGLVAAMLFHPDVFTHLLGDVQASNFSDPICGRAWKTMQELHASNAEIAPLTVFTRIGVNADDTSDEFVVAMDKLRGGSQRPPILEFIKEVRNRAALRRLMSLAEHIPALCGQPGVRAEQVIGEMAGELSDIETTMLPVKNTFTTLPDGMEAFIEKLQDRQVRDAIPTGFTELDQMIGGGMGRGELHVLGGSSSMGKTGFVTQLALNSARAGYGGVIVSLEMTSDQMFSRIASEMLTSTSIDGVAYRDLMRNNPAFRDDERFEVAVRHWMAQKNLPLTFDFRSVATVADIRGTINRARDVLAQMGKKLDFVVVDYLNLMTPSGRYGGNRVQEIGEIVNGLKSIAKSEAVAMLFLSQLNRAVVHDGEVQRPTMSNLRESGEIEQHADMIWFVFREAYALERKSFNELEPEERERLATLRQQLELIVAKFRNGETGSVELFVDLPRNAIRDRMTMGAAV